MNTSAHFITEGMELRWIAAKKFMLKEPVAFYTAKLKGTLVAPAGFVTDFASIPQIFGGLFPASGDYDRAAVLHDAAYEGKLLVLAKDDTGSEVLKPVRLIKRLADDLFLEAMETDGVGWLTRRLMYRAVQKFGRKGQVP